jgi:alkanesulfonate monooxygenase SsuD/methylene tetrahydromethanopterin reductase-like flavin-dependent oxidoreductase (luciferase family)
MSSALDAQSLHRGGLVRPGAPAAGLRVRHVHGAVRKARGGTADHRPQAARRATSFSGKWYHTESAINEPRYRDHIPIMLGGSGEKTTFRLAARYADHLNIITNISELPGKLDMLRQR